MDFEERIVAPDYTGLDSDIETSLRPKVLTDYIGQEKAKDKSCKGKRRKPRPCASLRPSGTR